MALAYHTVNVFTQRRFAGNPLAVVTDARGLTPDVMQQIASEFNYSETTFVLPAKHPSRTACLRIFTPTREIPFAGHPNIGTAFVLGRQGWVFDQEAGDTMCFELKSGPVTVELQWESAEVVGATIAAPQPLSMGPQIDPETLAACVSLDGSKISPAIRPRIVSVGLPFAVAELVDRDALAQARPSEAAFSEVDQRFRDPDDRFSAFIYARRGHGTDHLRARMFTSLGRRTREDPGTGSAAAALAAYLAQLDPRRDSTFHTTIEQGIEIGRPSRIDLAVRKALGRVNAVSISGRCVGVMRGAIEL
jgi:trans-2,3-dihydro-3-hydroxyanthranilate isomerase